MELLENESLKSDIKIVCDHFQKILIDESGPSKKNVSINNNLTLGDGLLGPIFFSNFMRREEDSEKETWEKITYSYVEQAVELLKDSKNIYNSSLFSGLAGVCLAVLDSANNEERYFSLLKKIEPFLIKKIYNSYVKPIESKIEAKEFIHPAYYETVSGLSGILGYLLLRVSDEKLKPVTSYLVELLVKMLHRTIDLNGIEFFGWVIQPIAAPIPNIHYSEEYYNLSLSHGIAGCLSALSLALKSNIEVQGQKELISKISNWLIEKAIFEDEVVYWPSVILANGSASDSHKRACWCYGNPGISRALFLAGEALLDEKLKDFALSSIKSILKKKDAQRLISPSLCHGLSGLLMVVQRMFLDTKDTFFKEKADEITNEILNYYNLENPCGFSKMHSENNMAYLEGGTGIVLSLLEVQFGRRSIWAVPLMIG